MIILKSTLGEASRFSFSVSRKVDKRASVRNSLRRKGYAAVRGLLPKVVSSFFIVFAFRRCLEKPELPYLRLEIEKLLQKANLILAS